jgi:hypothetical protein
MIISGQIAVLDLWRFIEIFSHGSISYSDVRKVSPRHIFFWNLIHPSVYHNCERDISQRKLTTRPEAVHSIAHSPVQVLVTFHHLCCLYIQVPLKTKMPHTIKKSMLWKPPGTSCFSSKITSDFTVTAFLFAPDSFEVHARISLKEQLQHH